MGRRINISGLFINTKITRSAHSCRYCSISKKEFSNLSISRFAAVVESLIDWTAAHRPELKIFPCVNNSVDYDDETRASAVRLRRLAGQSYDVLTTGGLRIRPENEIQIWLRGWRDLNVKCVHATYAGHGAVHDRWNGRAGDFEYLIGIQRIAGQLEMKLGQSLFLTKSTRPYIEDLIAKLDAIPAEIQYRWVFPIGYIGLGARLEDDRIDEEIRNALPATHLPEIAWFEIRDLAFRARMDRDHFRRRGQIICVHSPLGNQGFEYRLKLKKSFWDEVISDLEKRTRSAYSFIPPVQELCKRYGDRNSKLIYDELIEIDRVWLDRHLREYPNTFEGHLTNLMIDQ